MSLDSEEIGGYANDAHGEWCLNGCGRRGSVENKGYCPACAPAYREWCRMVLERALTRERGESVALPSDHIPCGARTTSPATAEEMAEFIRDMREWSK